jgi:predicted Zn-dependent protease
LTGRTRWKKQCPWKRFSRAEIYLAQGDIQRTLSFLRPVVNDKNRNGLELMVLATAEARAGDAAEARHLLRKHIAPPR